MAIERLEQWIAEEKVKGAPNPQQAVLSTVSQDGVPHARIVAIREITAKGLLFFSQKGTKKVTEMAENPCVNLTFWFELTQRQVIIEALVEALSEADNQVYWDNYPKAAQIRFLAYAPTSGQCIDSKQTLEDKRQKFEQQYDNENVPCSPFYLGFRALPYCMTFYHYRTDELSDQTRFTLSKEGQWQSEILSP